jgi:hypothetical protein
MMWSRSLSVVSVGLVILGASACGGVNSAGIGGSPDGGGDSTTPHTDSGMGPLHKQDGSSGPCTPRTCADLGANCGPQGDGCGSLLQCGTCTGSETCGGGGKPNQCGTGSSAGDGASPCVPTTCTVAKASCGPVGDGCGNVLQCGTCTAPEVCGGAGIPYVCGDGMGADGAACLAPLGSCASAAGPVCVNFQTDSNNCGSCGVACATGLACIVGVCTPQCTGSVTCDTAAGQVCVGDHCANACDVALTGTSSEGCEFWPVHLWNTEDGPGYFQGPLGIVASNTSTSVTATVTLEDESGIIATQMVAPGTAATFQVPNAQNRLTQTQSGNAFHLRSTVPIAAYEYNPVNAAQAFTGSAALLLPTHTLAQSYFVVSYTYNASIGTSPPQGQGYLAVIGTQPNTAVTVTVPVATMASGDGTIAAAAAGGTINFTLGQGEVVEIAEAASLQDITGATISANKPVAAFGGSGATTVPDTALGGDHFEVQLFPTAAWGTSYECEKYTKRSPIDVDRWRIVGGVNGTVVTLSDPSIATVPVLAAGQVFEFTTAENFDLTASEPVLVAHYLQAWGTLAGSQYDPATFPNPTTNACPFAGGANDAECIGDASMTLAIPTAQYLSDYTFYTPSSYAYSYVDVIVPMGAMVTLDGAAIPALTAIGAGAYGLAQIPVASGVHTITGDHPFGITLYGYDYAISYTCVGGLDLKTIGFTGPPGTCKPLTCMQQGFKCGPAGDGCGGELMCGTCVAPETCGGGGTPSQCGSSACTPLTCASLHINCGPAGNGCGGEIQCGDCVSPQTCGGGGTPGICGMSGGA